jgi:radical SAM superfamily enzyme YgiQ (UPF0313 family)
MRVAVVYPEVYDLARFHEKRKEFPPFGPLYLAAVAEEAGHTVSILKVSHGKTFLDLRSYDAVAFSASSSATYGLIRDCRYGSMYSPSTLILVGGVHANFFPEETFRDLGPHVVCFGEGEETLLELLNLKQELMGPHAKSYLSRIDGICFEDEGVVRKTSPRTFNKDIDWLPLPARHLLDPADIILNDRLAGTNVQMAHVMLSRGCPFPCRFCAAAKQRMQYRSGASARRELIHLKERYGINGFSIVDDNFIVNKEKVFDVCRGIADLGLLWSALSRVDTVNPELLQAMRESGCIEIKYGMESGSEAILKAMEKRISREQIRKAVRDTHAQGIGVKLFVIHGYPGENMDTTKETLGLLQELRTLVERVSLFRFVPLPGTYVYNNPEEFSLRNTDRQQGWNGDWSRYHIHHNPEHWWGTEEDFQKVEAGYKLLKDYVDAEWPERYHLEDESETKNSLCEGVVCTGV